MAKKYKNNKVANRNATPGQSKQKNKSAFNAHALKVQAAKQKRIQKIGDTKSRLLSKKRENKVIRMSGNLKKIQKFALMDQQNDNNGYNSNQLTHKGVNIEEIKHFNDMNFKQDDWDGEEIQKIQTDLNFAGFQQENQNRNLQGKPKTKNQIYKEIIDKSKKYKRQRQEQYEQNFQKAVQLDQNYQDILQHLKFRNQDTKVRQRIQKTDKDYQKLINQLKDDERVVANRVIVNDGKGKEKVSKRRNQQLKKLLKQKSDDQQQDLRGWVKDAGESSEDSMESSEEDISQDDQSEGSEQEESQSLQQSDELDDIQLSSGDQDEQQEDDQAEEDDQEQRIKIVDYSQSPQEQKPMLKKQRKAFKKSKKSKQ